jgi:hypothetical protein
MRHAGLTIALIALTAVVAGCSKPDPVNMNETGALEAGDSTHPDDGSFYDEYKFKAAEGYTITVNMTSEAFDSYLHLRGPDGADLQQNDDVEPGNLNSRITLTAPETGEYTVLANSRGAGETGAYTVTIVTAAN